MKTKPFLHQAQYILLFYATTVIVIINIIIICNIIATL